MRAYTCRRDGTCLRRREFVDTLQYLLQLQGWKLVCWLFFHLKTSWPIWSKEIDYYTYLDFYPGKPHVSYEICEKPSNSLSRYETQSDSSLRYPVRISLKTIYITNYTYMCLLCLMCVQNLLVSFQVQEFPLGDECFKHY